MYTHLKWQCCLCFHRLYNSLSGLILQRHTEMLSLEKITAFPFLHLALCSMAFFLLHYHFCWWGFSLPPTLWLDLGSLPTASPDRHEPRIHREAGRENHEPHGTGTHYRLVGLVVKVSGSRAGDPGSILWGTFPELQLLPQCGSSYNCLSRSVPEIQLHVAVRLSSQQSKTIKAGKQYNHMQRIP